MLDTYAVDDRVVIQEEREKRQYDIHESIFQSEDVMLDLLERILSFARL